MLEPQNILLSSPPLLPTSSYTDKANSEGIEFEDLQYSCHPQSIEFSELLMTTPDLEEDNTKLMILMTQVLMTQLLITQLSMIQLSMSLEPHLLSLCIKTQLSLQQPAM